uniref:Uncharacterized protein n=1 Tax=Globisporangium ultimum (strain ATCC 200006 / CBS 805.95 / DAOM BR144) TaxID=431595 RepID=K3WCS8_GLOUD
MFLPLFNTFVCTFASGYELQNFATADIFALSNGSSSFRVSSSMLRISSGVSTSSSSSIFSSLDKISLVKKWNLK